MTTRVPIRCRQYVLFGFGVVLLLLCGALCDAQIAGHAVTLDASIRRLQADQATGPAAVTVINVNSLRYDVTVLQEKVVLAEGPKPSEMPVLFVSIPKRDSATQMAINSLTAVMESLDESEKNAVNDGIKLLGKIDQEANAAQTVLDQLREKLLAVTSFVEASDQALVSSGAQYVATEANGLAMSIKDLLEEATWPDAASIRDLEQENQSLSWTQQPMFSSDALSTLIAEHPDYATQYLAAMQVPADTANILQALNEGSEQHQSFLSLRRQLESWKYRLSGVSETSFTQTFGVPCGSTFLSHKTTTYQLRRRDLLEKDASKAVSTEPLVSVVCSSVLSISGGFGATGIDARNYRFVTSVETPANDGSDSPTPANRIAVDASSEQLTGIFLLNARFTNNPVNNWHASAGTSVDLDAPDSSVAFGYLLGLSYSFKDTFFMTGGVQAARIHELAPGFELGDLQPAGVDAPPTVKSWDYDWFVAVTFKID